MHHKIQKHIDRLKQINLKRAGKKSIIGLLILLIAGGIFWSGILIGKKYYPSINLVKGVKNLETGKPADVDFSLFWDAWRLIQSDYVKAGKTDNQTMVYGAINGLLGSLGDPYSVFFDPAEAKKFNEDVTGLFSGVGIELGMKKNILTVISPLEDTPAWKAGIKAGDQIVKINDKVTSNMTIDDAINLIRGEKGTNVTFSIMRASFDKPKDFIVTRDTIVVPSTKVTYLDNNIAYLKLMNFNENAAYNFYRSAVEVLMKKSPGIILDLRNNPGGYLNVSVDIAGWLMKKGEVVVREDAKDGNETLFKAGGNQALVDIPVVVLINEGSASASEILAGALRDNRQVKLIGEKSYGKGSVQEIQKLFDDSMIKLTIAEWLTPNGTSINENGLEPDYKVELTDKDYEANKDPQLDKALEVIKQQINPQ